LSASQNNVRFKIPNSRFKIEKDDTRIATLYEQIEF